MIVDDRADGRAYSNTNECEADLGSCEAAPFNKNNWKCFKYWDICTNLDIKHEGTKNERLRPNSRPYTMEK